jgi:4-amino-4-deoxy-L-arabinose transferase-like glycosyltransferase
MGMPYDQKPPLAFWMFAGAIKAAGSICSWALRMPSVLAGIGLLILTYLMGRKFAGAAAGYFSGLLLISSLSFLDDAPAVELNMIYGFFTAASLAVWLLNGSDERLSWPACAGMWLLLAAAFLVKGPLAILVVLSAIGATAAARRSRKPFTDTRAVMGMILVLAIIGLWLIGQSRAWGAQFVEKQVTSETVERFLKGDHAESFFYYFPRLFSAFLGPWAFLLIAALLCVWRNRGKNPAWVAPLVGWITLPFFVLLLANGKRVPYLVPLLAPACLFAGIWTEQKLAMAPMKPVYQRALLGALILAAFLLLAAGVAFIFPDAWMKDPQYHVWINFDRFWPWAWFVSAALVAGLAWCFWQSQQRWAEGIWALALVIIILHTADMVMVRPALDPGKSTRKFAMTVQKLLDERGEDTLLTLPEIAEPEFHVYGDYKLKWGTRRSLDLTKPDLPRVLVLKQEEIETSGPVAMAAGYKPVAELDVTKKSVVIYVRD